jgi:hypothetical protein
MGQQCLVAASSREEAIGVRACAVVSREHTVSAASLLVLVLRAMRASAAATRKDKVSPRVTGRQANVVQVSQSRGLDNSAACTLAGRVDLVEDVWCGQRRRAATYTPCPC